MIWITFCMIIDFCFISIFCYSHNLWRKHWTSFLYPKIEISYIKNLWNKVNFKRLIRKWRIRLKMERKNRNRTELMQCLTCVEVILELFIRFFWNYHSMYKNIKILNKKQASWEKLNSGGIEGNHYYPIILCLVVYFTCWVRLRRFSDVKHPFCPNENVLILGRGWFRKNK